MTFPPMCPQMKLEEINIRFWCLWETLEWPDQSDDHIAEVLDVWEYLWSIGHRYLCLELAWREDPSKCADGCYPIGVCMHFKMQFLCSYGATVRPVKALASSKTPPSSGHLWACSLWLHRVMWLRLKNCASGYVHFVKTTPKAP